MSGEELLAQSERVYNFQRLLALRLGYGTRGHDYPPYRAVGPVTKEEYQSHAERYDKQLVEDVGVDLTDMTIEEKMASLREYRETRYEKLIDAVYKRRGWDENGVPTLEKVRELGIDFQGVMDLIKRNQI